MTKPLTPNAQAFYDTAKSMDRMELGSAQWTASFNRNHELAKRLTIEERRDLAHAGRPTGKGDFVRFYREDHPIKAAIGDVKTQLRNLF